MKFRTDISFLRALSVVIVLLFHFHVPGFSGGFIGVDVFFVISGFLMTMIVLKGFENNSYTLIGFYKRRINRLVPALATLLLFVLLISVFLFLEPDLKQNAKLTGLASLFVSNIYFFKYLNYFNPSGNILIHTWSLGVEWQFYLFYPLILMALKSTYFKNPKTFWLVLSTLTIISFLIAVLVGSYSTNFIFYMLPARYWELSIGGLAYGLGNYDWKINEKSKKTIVLIAIFLIIVCNSAISESNLWPSVLTLIPILATFIILSLNINFPFFNYPIIRFFGNISYSLYLWHWPWYILFRYFGFISWESIVLVAFLSIVSAYLSYKFIENNKKITNVKFSLLFLGLICSLSALFFIKPKITEKLSIYQSEKFKIGSYRFDYIETKQKDAQFNPTGCFISNQDAIKDYNKPICLTCDSTKKNILLIGDSHAAQYSASLRKLTDYNWLEASIAYNFPLLDSRGKKGMVDLNNYIYHEFIPKNKDKIDLVLISAHWLMRNNVDLNYSEDELLVLIKNTISYFEKYQIQYLFIGETESYLLEYPKILMLKNLKNIQTEQYLNSNGVTLEAKIKATIPTKNYINCYQIQSIRHFDANKKQPYMFDINHLTQFGADQYVQQLIQPKIKSILK
ncbi:MAG TPA: acyltransferase family protein [Chitinophagales bacterium]|nr:acyltransferase [Chitinophagales bacterium]HMY42106.1 acyltransferase family protein [Chitinophagales bacterium]HMZ93534.1 acyltransferase family protein [Chitinophagales bacterium]